MVLIKYIYASSCHHVAQVAAYLCDSPCEVQDLVAERKWPAFSLSPVSSLTFLKPLSLKLTAQRYTVWPGGVWKWNWQSHMNFMEFLHVHGNPQRIKTQRGNQKEAYLLDERQICEELTRQRAWARVSKQSEVPLQTRGSRTRLCSASSGAVSELIRVYLQQKDSYFLLLDRKGRVLRAFTCA